MGTRAIGVADTPTASAYAFGIRPLAGRYVLALWAVRIRARLE